MLPEDAKAVAEHQRHRFNELVTSSIGHSHQM